MKLTLEKGPPEMIAKIHVAIQRLPLIKSKNNRNSPTAIDTQNNYYTTDSKAYLTLLKY